MCIFRWMWLRPLGVKVINPRDNKSTIGLSVSTNIQQTRRAPAGNMGQQLLSCSRIAFSFSTQTPSPPLQHRHPFQASSHVDILRSMRLHLRDAFPELAQPRTATCKPLASIPFRGPSHLLLPPRDASQKQLALHVCRGLGCSAVRACNGAPTSCLRKGPRGPWAPPGGRKNACASTTP